jgi:hypothetical protein
MKAGLITRIGRWFDKHFPAKMSVEEVDARFTVMLDSLNDIRVRLDNDEKMSNLAFGRLDELQTIVPNHSMNLVALEAIVKNLESELSKLKTAMNATQIRLGAPQPQDVWKR